MPESQAESGQAEAELKDLGDTEVNQLGNENDCPEGTNETSTNQGKSVCNGSLVKMLIAMWALTLGVAIACTVHYNNKVKEKRTVKFSPPDMVDLGGTLEGFDTYLCGNINISASRNCDVYRLQHAPQIDQRVTNQYTVSDSLVAVGSRNKEERSFYLLSGSVVNVSVCFRKYREGSDNGTVIKALVFKGEASYNNSVNSENCDSYSCALVVHDIEVDRVCSSNNDFEFTVHADGTDTYHIVYHFVGVYNFFIADFGHVLYHLSLARYDLSSADAVCNNTATCDIELIYAKDLGVILGFGAPGIYDIYIKSECQLRVAYWVVIFLIIPVSVALVASLCCCVFCYILC